jgi:KDO2-lipid IV(A) lauroyltransferase
VSSARGRSGSDVAGRIRVAGLEGAARVLRVLPDRAIDGIATVGGEITYRVQRRRTAQARRNLRRVARQLVATDRALPHVAAAARDPRALERLVRSAHRHAILYYLDVARTPLLHDGYVRERLAVESPDALEQAFGEGRPVVFLSLHFGGIELAGRYLAIRTGRPSVAPMETLADPHLQAWMLRSRGRVGVHIVGLREARRELLAALRRGESVGLVADRDITGGGIEVPFFGAPAPLPAGPGLLTLEVDAPIYAAAIRRTGRGRYTGRLIPIDVPLEGTRRERLTETLRRIAAVFEELIANAPEQWWAVFMPIWPDLEAPAGVRDGDARRAPAGDAAAQSAGPAEQAS